MKFEAKNLSPVAFHALICVEVGVSIKCFDWSKMAVEVFPVARIDEYAKPCEPAIHEFRSVTFKHKKSKVTNQYEKTKTLKDYKGGNEINSSQLAKMKKSIPDMSLP